MVSKGRSDGGFRHAAAVAASLITGGTVVATRVAVVQLDPVTLAFLRYLLAGLCLAPFAWMIWRAEPAGRRDLFTILGLGLLLFGLAPWLFNLSLTMTSASRGAIAMGTAPIFGILFLHLSQFQPVGTVRIAALIVAAIGCLIAFAGGFEGGAVAGPRYWLGDLLMLAAACVTGACAMAAKPVLDRAPVLMIVGIAMLAGAAGLLAPAAAHLSEAGLPQLTNAGLLIILFLGILGGCVGVLLWLFAADGIAPIHLCYYFALAPASGLLMAFFVIGEPPTAALIIGMVLLAAGILGALWKPKPQRRERRGFR